MMGSVAAGPTRAGPALSPHPAPFAEACMLDRINAVYPIRHTALALGLGVLA